MATTNPNHPPTPNRLTLEQQKRDAISEFYSFLDAPAVAILRDEQRNLLATKKKGIHPLDKVALNKAEQAAYAEFGNLRKNYLNRAGVVEDPTGKRTDFQDFNKILETYSLDQMDDIEWLVGKTTDPSTGKLVPGREKLEENFDQLVTDMTEIIPISVNTISPSPELLQARDELKALREELATLSAKRMGRLRSRGKTKQEFERLQQEYHDKLIEVGQKEEELREQNDPTRTEDQKRLEVMMDLLGHEKDLRELTNDKLGDSKLDKLTRWLNSGSKLQRIGKGMLIALPLGALTGGAGVVIAAVLTGVGLVAAGTGTAASIATMGAGGKLFLNFIRRNTDRRINVNEVDTKAAQAALGRIDDVDTKTHAEIQGTTVKERGQELRVDVKEQQKRRRRTLGKAAIVTAFSIGVSTAASTLVQSVTNEIAPVFQEKHYGSGGQTSNGSGYEYGQNRTQFETEDTVSGGGSGGNGVPDSDVYPKAAGPQPEVTGGVPGGSEAEYSLEAQTVDSSEGLFSTFNQMGIPKADQAELLQKVGPKLANLHDSSGKPFAYLINGEPGNWGIHMTPDGKMPAGALDMIHQEHQSMIGTASEVAAPSSVVKMDVITPEEVANNDALNNLANVDVAAGTIEDGRAYAEILGFNPDAWDMVQHQMIEDYPVKDYPDLFVSLPGGRVGIHEGLLPDDVAADLFNRLENVNLPGGDSIQALDVIEADDINKSILDRFSIIPEFTDSAEEFLRENGFGHAWLEINKPEIASDIAKAAPSAFTFENGTLGIIPNGRITDEAWAIIANHMNAVERARVGIG